MGISVPGGACTFFLSFALSAALTAAMAASALAFTAFSVFAAFAASNAAAAFALASALQLALASASSPGLLESWETLSLIWKITPMLPVAILRCSLRGLAGAAAAAVEVLLFDEEATLRDRKMPNEAGRRYCTRVFTPRGHVPSWPSCSFPHAHPTSHPPASPVVPTAYSWPIG